MRSVDPVVPGAEAGDKAPVAAGLKGKLRRGESLAFHLSRDARLGKGDRGLAASKADGRFAVKVPRGARPGFYRLLACVEDRCKAAPFVVLSRFGSGKQVDAGAIPDSARAVTQRIAAASGGTIAATAADGSVLTLSIPADALLEDTDVTVTPLAKLTGLGRGPKLVAGAQLGPDGLDLYQPASLTIAPKQMPPAKRLAALAYRGSGDDIGFTLGERSKGAVSIPFLHFSGGALTNMEIRANLGLAHSPSDRLAWAARNYAAAAGLQRATELLGASGDDVRTTTAKEVLLWVWANEAVDPDLVAAAAPETDDEPAENAALGENLAWRRFVELAGLTLPPGLAAWIPRWDELVRRINAKQLIRRYKRCQQHELTTSLLRSMVDIARKRGLEGAGGDVAQELFEDCLTFKYSERIGWQLLDTHSDDADGLLTMPEPMAITTRVLFGDQRWREIDTTSVPEVPLVYEAFHYRPNGGVSSCADSRDNPNHQTFATIVTKPTLPSVIVSYSNGREDPVFALIRDRGETKEQVHCEFAECCLTVDGYNRVYDALYAEQRIPDFNRQYSITNFVVSHNEQMARASYQRSKVIYQGSRRTTTASEDSEYVIHHTPPALELTVPSGELPPKPRSIREAAR